MAPTKTREEVPRLAVPLSASERAALDRLATEDRRTRPEQIKWLIEQEVARRDGAREAVGSLVTAA